MNKRVAALAAAMVLVTSASVPAFAGVVITENESIVSGQPGGGPPQPARQRTMMIEGNKQKMIIEGGRAVIFDLDKGTMEIIDPAQKNYMDAPFPPHGMMAQAVGGPGLHASQFTKGGTSRTIAGYKCDDYNGTGKIAMGDFTMVYCVSSKAPGAADYTKFQKAMMAKLKDTNITMPPNLPEGIPLVEDVTTTMGAINMPNLPPGAAEQLKKQFANRPPVVTKTEVTKVESKKIAASEFEIPAGYTKRETRMGMGRPGMPPMGGHVMMGSPGSSPAAGASPASTP
jgi:hypothetical protein